MAEFLPAHLKTMGDEGRWANNPADKGGETYMGISRYHWPAWSGWKIIDQVKATLPVQPRYGTANYNLWVRMLNKALAANSALREKVRAFYLANFWTPNLLSEVRDQVVATWLYNHIVNGGARGVMWMQSAAGVKADGDCGPKTIAAINAANPVQLLKRAMDNAVAYRLQRVRQDPSQKQFLESWLARDGVSPARIRQIVATV